MFIIWRDTASPPNVSFGSLLSSQAFTANSDDVKPATSSMVDLTSISPFNSSLGDDELPPAVFSNYVTTDTLYHIFTPAFSVQTRVQRVCGHNIQAF